MKIGIVTIYDNSNIGNRLQNYALQQILLKYADSVITIKNKASSSSLVKRLSLSLNLGESMILNKILHKNRKINFLRFNKTYLSMSNKCYFYDYEYHNHIENCDYYCTGSDQVWNPLLKITGKLHFLGFSDRNKNFSFAASFGIDKIDDKYKDNIIKEIENIKYISVREDAGKKIVEDISRRSDVTILIDPTLYLDKTDWSSISLKPKFKTPQRYILLYFLGGISYTRRKEIERIADKYKIDIIDILDNQSCFYNAGPSEFLFLIQNASLVCTDSYHASVFSFIYEKPFAIFPREGMQYNMGSRLSTLTEKFHLQDYIINNEVIPDNIFNVDFQTGKEILRLERRKVDEYLDKIFNNAYRNSI